MTQQDVIIVEVQPNLIIATISTNPLNKMPFKTFTGTISTKVGDLYTLYEDNSLYLTTPYNIHTFELATVIGKKEKDLLVYGDKIGEKIIKDYQSQPRLNNALFDVQRDDELLLSKQARNQFVVIHNITQAYKKYNHHMRTK